MTFEYEKTPLEGAYILIPRVFNDNRGSFRMTYVKEEFEEMGIESDFVQTNISLSIPKYTLRGMHFQKGEAAQDKLVRCLKGSIIDVIIDIREDSPTFGKYFSEELTYENEKIMFVPKGFAHGFITLTENTEVLYQVSAPYAPKAEGGIRYNDPFFNIKWPTNCPVLSEKDSLYPDFRK